MQVEIWTGKTWSARPFFFLTAAWCIGLSVAVTVQPSFSSGFYLLVLVLLLLGTGLSMRFVSSRLASTLLLLLAVLVCGVWRMDHIFHEASRPLPTGVVDLRVRLSHAPALGSSYRACRATVLGAEMPGCEGMKVQFYFQATGEDSDELSAGDVLRVRCRLDKPPGSEVPYGRDMSRELQLQGIWATALLKPGDYVCLHRPSFSLLRTAERLRRSIPAFYLSSGITGQDLATLVALTTGERGLLSYRTAEQYRHAGVYHLFALSGLHVGVLFALLQVLFFPLLRRGVKGRRAALLLSVLSLWLFAFWVGFSPSIVRTVCMWSLPALGLCFRRRTDVINLLFATAGLMLLIFPPWLFDLGFQLSFLAVLSILLFAPTFRAVLFANVPRWCRWLADLLSVTLAAQVLTFPLVLYRFSAFSLLCLLSNMVLVPLVSLVLCCPLLLALAYPFAGLRTLAVGLTKTLLHLIQHFAMAVENLYALRTDVAWISSEELLCIYLFIFALCYALRCGVRKILLPPLLAAGLLLAVHARVHWFSDSSPSVVCYATRGTPAIHFIGREGVSHLFLLKPVPETVTQLTQKARLFWLRQHLHAPKLLVPAVQPDGRPPAALLLTFGDFRLLVVQRWSPELSDYSLAGKVDMLYLSPAFRGDLSDLCHRVHPQRLLIAPSISARRAEVLQQEAAALQLPVTTLRTAGAQVFPLACNISPHAVPTMEVHP